MKKLHIWMLLGIVVLGAFFRFYLITEIPPGLYPDEAMNGNNALEALSTGAFKIFYPENNGREGFFINIQAISLALFGNEPWALRIVSALFGTLTLFGIYLVAKELLASNAAALLASFFLASSYWHINFSRIGFRAIMVPFFAAFGIYFLLKGLRRGNILDLALAGICTGLGLHTYIAFRLMAPVFALPLIEHIRQWRKKPTTYNLQPATSSCSPCAAALFAFVVFVVALPLAVYFVQHPQNFSGRINDVSVFSAASPLKEFTKSAVLTAGMFFWRGDCNWRHNFNCAPALHPLVAVFLLIGALSLWRLRLHSWKKWLIAVWAIALMLPATLTREGIPHALRAIGMIPPLMIVAGLGADQVRIGIIRWTEKERARRPQYLRQIGRLRHELLFLFLLILLTIPLAAYRAYFLFWSSHPKTYEAFETPAYHLGQFLARLPQDTKKYVIVNARGVDVRGIPMPAETVMFATDSFTPEKQARKNITYIATEPGTAPADMTFVPSAGKTAVAFIDSGDAAGIAAVRRVLPGFTIQAPGDFVILQNE